MTGDERTQLLGEWPVGNAASTEPIASYTGRATRVITADGAVYVLKEESGTVEDVQKCVALLRHLQECSLPVAVPLQTTHGATVVTRDGRAFTLSAMLPGRPVTDHFSGDAGARAEAFGEALGRLHTGLYTFRDSIVFPRTDIADQVEAWALPIIRRHSDAVDVARIDGVAAELSVMVMPLYAGLPEQLIHRDPNPSNLLFEEGRLTGIIDFDHAIRCVRVFDPCYCATSMLVGGWSEPAHREAWPGLLRALMRGYGNCVSLREPEVWAVWPMLLAIELNFMAFGLEAGALPAAQCNEQVLYWLADRPHLMAGDGAA